MNTYMTAYKPAYEDYQADMSVWRSQEPSHVPADYDSFLSDLKLKHPVGYQTTDVDVLDADCKRVKSGYGYSGHVTFGTCKWGLSGVDCPGYVQGVCKITDAEVSRLVDEWEAKKPVFNPPDTKKIICMECLQHAENVVATGKNVVNADILQRALQTCSFVTGGSQTTLAPQGTSAAEKKLMLLGGGVVVIVVVLLILILFVV
jgi:hypothetical protein